MVIYKITNKINNKCYIGQTINTAEARWERHQNDALSNRLDTHFARAIRKYKPESFELEIIDTASNQEELTKKENYWINFYNSVNNGYNETLGIDKCGGNTYKSKTNEELENIREKIRQTKLGGLNINATPVKCRNIKTNEEYFFDSQAEMMKFFNQTSHIFISRRCLGRIKKPYLNEWEIAFQDKDYNENLDKTTQSSTLPKIKYITVKKLSTLEEKDFPTYAEAERYFNQKRKSFSSKASKKPNTFIYKEEYQITKHYD